MGVAERNNPFNRWKQEAGANQYDVYDRFGRQIGAGDLVMLPMTGDIMWRVTETKPIMDPKAPPGLVQMTLAAVMIEGVQGGVPQPALVKLRDRSEFKDAPAGEPPPADPAEEMPPNTAEGPKLVIP
jgi:hypothetical protein